VEGGSKRPPKNHGGLSYFLFCIIEKSISSFHFTNITLQPSTLSTFYKIYYILLLFPYLVGKRIVVKREKRKVEGCGGGLLWWRVVAME
jgi:hypothetical protein